MGVLKLRNLLGIATTLLAAPLCIAPRAALAQDAVTYANSQRTFKVGILLVDSTIDLDGNGLVTAAEQAAGPENPDPYVFQIVDQRKEKPLGWNLINPVAPKTVTTEVYNRWLARDPAHPYRIGEGVQKNMAAYWEVSLTNTPLSELIQFDALLLTTHARLKFSLSDREKLRKLVDAGGMLWMDDCGGMRVDPAGPFFLDQLQFQGSRPDSPAVAPGSGLPFVFQPEHPLLNSPNRLSLRDISLLGEFGDYRNRSLATLNPTGGASLQQSPNPGTLTNVVGNLALSGLPYIAVANYGSGTFLATCGDTGCAINDRVGGFTNAVGSGRNSGSYLNNPRLEAAETEDVKFVYNLIQLGGSNATFRKNARRVGASTENLRSPLTNVFDFTTPDAADPNNRVNSTSSPLVVRDRVYVSGLDASGAVTVRCYNAKPSYQRGDEGWPDLQRGTPYDEVWRATTANPSSAQPSSPVLATVYNPVTARYQDVIYVTLGDGSVLAMPALPRDGSGVVLPVNSPSIAPTELVGSPSSYDGIKLSDGSPGPAPAPVVYENRVYVIQPDGVLRCLDANTLGTLWKSADAAFAEPLTPTGSPTLGVVQLSESASSGSVAGLSNGTTNDIMLYVPVIRPSNGSGKMLPFWLGTRHEVISQPAGAPGSYATRVFGGGNNAHWVANTVATPAPSFLRAAVRVYNSRIDMETGVLHPIYTGVLTDAGVVEVRDGSNNPPPPGLQLFISVDYDVLYIPGGAGPALGTPPGAVASGTYNGSRNPNSGGLTTVLDIPSYTQSGDYTASSWGFDTPVMAPNDTLFTAVRQQAGPASGGTPPTTMRTRASILGMREQFGGSGISKLRQSFTVLERNATTVVPTDDSAIRMPYDLGGLQGVLIEASTFVNPFRFSGAPGQPVEIVNGSGQGLGDLSPVGPPVLSTSDGVLYVLLQGPTDTPRPVTVIAAIDADRETTLRVKPFDGSKQVLVRQLNALTYPGDSNVGYVVQTAGTATASGNLDLDPQAGTITIKNMAVGNDRFSSSQSFFVTYTPRDQGQPVTIVVSPSARVQTVNNAAGNGDVADPALPRQDYSPLLWYYVLPGTPTGGLSRVGGTLFYNSRFGIVGVDADPTSNDPDVRPGEAIRNIADEITRYDSMGNPVVVTSTINHVRWVQGLGGGLFSPFSAAAPVAGPDTIVANTAQGTFAFENSTTLIADSGRIIEVGGDGAPLWAMDATVNYQVVGGNLPVDDPVNPIPGNGRQIIERRKLNHPAVARKLTTGDYLIADTGNNRLVRADRSARTSWEVSQVIDPFGILKNGDPLALNNPTDVQYYEHPTYNAQGQKIRSEDHYLIADAGNFRLLEVVDYRDQSGAIRTDVPGVTGRAEHVVVWATRTATAQGRRLRFKSAQRVYTTVGGVSGIPTVVATIDNASVSGESASVGADFTGGSLVRLDYRPINTFFALSNAATGAFLPPVGTGEWAPTGTPTTSGFPWLTGSPEPPYNGAVAEVLDSVIFPAGTLQAAAVNYRITRPTYFQQLTVQGRLIFIVCDVNGVYQIEQQGTNRVVTWYFNQADYNRVNAQRILSKVPVGSVDPASLDLPAFHPVSAQRMPNGNVLITNAASGPSSLFEDGQFRGEVLEVSGGTRVGPLATLPTFGDFSAPAWAISAPANLRVRVRQRMGNASATQPLEQPLFADRL